MADDANAQVDAAASLPLEERLVHKVWKVRLAAYEALEGLYKGAEDGDKVFVQYNGIWKNIVPDSNAAAQEKGLDALIAFFDRAPVKESQKVAGIVAPLLVEKCLSQREKTKQKALECMLMVIEVEAQESAITNLIKGGSHKVPKICAASIMILKEAIRLFGPKAVPIKPILPALAGFFDNPDKNVRQEAFNLVVEVYRWLGAIVKTQLGDLRPAQVKDLEAAFEGITAGKAIPERFLRSQNPAFGAAPPQQEAAQEKEQEVDAFDLLEPQEVLGKLPGDFYEQVGAAKWSIRRDALDALINLASPPRLKPGDYSELTKTLKKLLNDANVIVVSKAAKALGLLAQGLRKDFAGNAKSVFATLLEKFKEKKAQVVEAIHEALDFMYAGCFTLPDVIDDILATQENKVPKVRQDTLIWLTRCLEKSTAAAKRATITKVVKQLGNFLLVVIDDGASEVRDAAAITFGKLIGVVGERALKPYLDKLDKIKLQKVKEHAPEAPAAAPGAPVGTPIDVSELGLDLDQPKEKKEDKKDTKAPAKKEPAKKAPAKATKTAAPAKKTSAASDAKGKKGKASPVEELNPVLSPEEAADRIKDILPDSIIAGLSSSNWKERLAATEELSTTVEKLEIDSAFDVIIRQLEKKPSFKESNVQVLSNVFSVIAKMSRATTNFSKGGAAIVIPGIVEKITDAKIKQAAYDCLSAFTEVSCPQFTFGQLYKCSSKHKNPKVVVEVLAWMSTAVEDFGIGTLQLKGMIDYIREGFDSNNPGIKSQAIKTLGVLRRFVGPGIRDFVSDIKSTLLASIDDEFNKVGNDPAPEPKKAFREAAASGSGGGGGSGDALPRTDISDQITPELLKSMSDNNWKTRKEAIDEVHGIILGANKRILPNLGELMPALKLRVNDTNKNIAIATLELLSMIAASMGPPIEKQIKIIVPAILNNLTDNNKRLRETSVDALSALAKEATIEQCIPLVAGPLQEAPPSRKDILLWMQKFLGPGMQARPSLDLVVLVKPLVSCLEDKSAEVRKAAEAILKEIVPKVGFSRIQKASADLKPASKLVVAPILESIRNVGKPDTPAQAEAPAEATSNVKTVKKQPPGKQAKEAAPAKGPTKPVEVVPIVKSDKETRIKKERKLKWHPDENRQEMIELVSEQMNGTFRDPLYTKMCSSDFKHHVEALTELTNLLEKMKDEIITNLDILLKWSCLRLGDNNVPVLKKAIDFLLALFAFLDSYDYHLTDYEASILLAFLTDKVGHNNDTLRQGMRSIFRMLCRLYPASKIFKLIVDGLKSKNTRSRADCIEELGILIEQHGVSVGGAKGLAIIGDHIAERDSGIRNAALIALVRAYSIIQNEIWKQLPNLPDSSKEALHEKIKHSAEILKSHPIPATPPKTPTKQPPTPASSDNTPSEVGNAEEPASNSVEKKFSVEMPEYSIELPSLNFPSLQSFNFSQEGTGSATYDYNPSRLGGGAQDSNGLDATVILSTILSGDENKAIESLKLLCLGDDDSIFLLHSDDLVNNIVARMRLTLQADFISWRLYKYLLNTLHKMYSKEAVAKSVSLTSLQTLLSEVLLAMNNAAVVAAENEQHLVKALHLLLIEVLDHSSRAACYSVLFELLNNKDAYYSNAFKDLVSKCLLKLTKGLPASIDEINLSMLLRDIHTFLSSQPGDGMPLRTVKTILNEAVGVKRADILKYLNLIPGANAQPAPAIVNYINAMLKGHQPRTIITNPAVASEQEIKMQLTEIIKKIGSKDTVQQGLQELWKFQKNYPQIDIQPYLQRTSPHFQAFIKKGLDAIEQQRQQAENRDPNTLKAGSAAPSGNDQFAMSYMDRLRKLQQQYALKKDDTASPITAPVATTPTLVDTTLLGLRPKTTSTFDSSNSTNEELSALSGGSNSNGSTETTVADLRSRLARIKSSIATNPSSNP